jgi:hypothetical protein
MGTHPRRDATFADGLEKAVFDIHLGKMIIAPSIILGLQRLVRYLFPLHIKMIQSNFREWAAFPWGDINQVCVAP